MNKLRLHHPITVDGKKVKSLSFRRPVFGDTIRLLSADNIGTGLIAMAIDLAGLTVEQAALLDLEDFSRLFVHLEAELTRLGINAATTVPE